MSDANLFIPDDIFPADVAIVFGITAWRRPTVRAVELYRDRLARKLLFTGGFNRNIQAVEAMEMADAARAAGVPDQDIIVEADATHTAANVRNAYSRIAEELGIDNVDAIVLVAIHFHMRRVKAIAERVFPRRIRLSFASYPSAYYTSLDWSRSERGRADVAAEERKLTEYLNGLDPP